MLGADDGEFVTRTRSAVREAIERRVRQLGLEPQHDVAFLDEMSFDVRVLEEGLPVAAVYFGGPTHAMQATAVAAALVQHGAFVVPVVPDLTTFPFNVPSVLAGINGDAPGVEGELPQRVASCIVQGLGLLRRRRLAFVSYKRSESTGVARQLHEALEERGFEVFLDTHSVAKGAEFQPVLWDRMSDADVVVLLDTPGAFTSEWIEKEISTATMLGLAILQIVWPGHQRTLGTDLCDVDYLATQDFDGDPTNAAVRLQADKLGLIAARIEDLRARSFVARRQRLFGVASRLASARGIDLRLQRDGNISVRVDGNDNVARIFPFIGHPDATHLHGAHSSCQATDLSGSACVLYDPASMLAATSGHLRWLNEFLPLKALSPEDLDAYLIKWAGARK